MKQYAGIVFLFLNICFLMNNSYAEGPQVYRVGGDFQYPPYEFINDD